MAQKVGWCPYLSMWCSSQLQQCRWQGFGGWTSSSLSSPTLHVARQSTRKTGAEKRDKNLPWAVDKTEWACDNSLTSFKMFDRWRLGSGRQSDASFRRYAGASCISESVGRLVWSATNRRTGRSPAVRRKAARESTASSAGETYTSVLLDLPLTRA